MICLRKAQTARWLAGLWALTALAGGAVFGQAPTADPPENQALERKRQAAEATYDLIDEYIKKEDYAKAQKEVRNLFDLKLPARLDEPVRVAILNIADKLIKKQQFQVAHRMLDMALKEPIAQRDSNEFYFLMGKAQIYKAEGHNDKAIEYFHKAQARAKSGGER